MTADPAPRAERLQKVVARSGLASRRAADQMIAAGRVAVDGRTAPPVLRVDPARVEIMVDGIRLPSAPGLVHYLLNKPAGVISTARDPQGRPTVVELVPARPRVFPAGRLDADATGLLLLTNDGDFANQVAHPSRGVAKTYEALVEGAPARRHLAAMRRGVELEDGPARALAVRRVGSDKGMTHLEIVMGEGRNREVKRMCAAAGFPVVRLHRSSIGPLPGGGLRTGEWRRLEIGEVRAFYEIRAEEGA